MVRFDGVEDCPEDEGNAPQGGDHDGKSQKGIPSPVYTGFGLCNLSFPGWLCRFVPPAFFGLDHVTTIIASFG